MAGRYSHPLFCRKKEALCLYGVLWFTGIYLPPLCRLSCCRAVLEFCVAQDRQHAGLFAQFTSHDSRDIHPTENRDYFFRYYEFPERVAALNSLDLLALEFVHTIGVGAENASSKKAVQIPES